MGFLREIVLVGGPGDGIHLAIERNRTWMALRDRTIAALTAQPVSAEPPTEKPVIAITHTYRQRADNLSVFEYAGRD